VSPLVDVRHYDAETDTYGKLYKKPKVATLIEPERGKPYQHASVVSVNGWCLSLVGADDFSVLAKDAECRDLFERDFAVPFDETTTIRDLRMPTTKLITLKNALIAREVDMSDVTLDTTVAAVLLKTLITIDKRAARLLLAVRR